MTKNELNRLRSLPIEGVAERLGLQVARHKSLCPFHDDHHASMTYSPRRNTFRCFACGAHGNTIDLVMRHLGKSFPEACRWLADGTNIILDKWKPKDEEYKPPKPFDAQRYLPHFEHPWLSDEAQRFLFQERRLDKRVVRWCRLNSWTDRQGTPWLEIPYYDTKGGLIGVQNRNLTAPIAPSNSTAPSNSPKGERAAQNESNSPQSAPSPLGGIEGALPWGD